MIEENAIYNIERVSIESLDDGSISLQKMISKEMAGVIVDDFLSLSEVESILVAFRGLNETELVHINNGFDSYPMSFAQFDQMANANKITEAEYFEKANRFNRTFKSRFGVDVQAKLEEVITKIGGEIQLEIPRNSNKDGQYVSFTFRELFPNDGCLKAHCENLFFHEFPSFFHRINKFSVQENQLSFFIVLQEPGSGGELTLYDLIWDDNQRRINDIQIKINQTEISVEDEHLLKRDYYTPKAGSLVIFSGGEIWHRVETILAPPSRITLGGFFSFSQDKKTLYSWS